MLKMECEWCQNNIPGRNWAEIYNTADHDGWLRLRYEGTPLDYCPECKTTAERIMKNAKANEYKNS